MRKDNIQIEKYLNCGHEQVITDEIEVRCDWCNDEFELSELTETDVGLLCDTCIKAIESRGERVIKY